MTGKQGTKELGTKMQGQDSWERTAGKDNWDRKG
jgi:hypothetical protein